MKSALNVFKLHEIQLHCKQEYSDNNDFVRFSLNLILKR